MTASKQCLNLSQVATMSSLSAWVITSLILTLRAPTAQCFHFLHSFLWWLTRSSCWGRSQDSEESTWPWARASPRHHHTSSEPNGRFGQEPHPLLVRPRLSTDHVDRIQGSATDITTLRKTSLVTNTPLPKKWGGAMSPSEKTTPQQVQWGREFGPPNEGSLAIDLSLQLTLASAQKIFPSQKKRILPTLKCFKDVRRKEGLLDSLGLHGCFQQVQHKAQIGFGTPVRTEGNYVPFLFWQKAWLVCSSWVPKSNWLYYQSRTKRLPYVVDKEQQV